MRRALVLLVALVACLLPAAPALAPAAPYPPAEDELEFYEEQKDVIFALTAEGFTVEVLAEDNDGDQTASLSISRDGLLAEYIAPATITEHRVVAKFGSLGELNFQFKPRKCRGGLALTGTFTFTGENGYVHVDTDHAEGSFTEQAYTACGPRGPIKPVRINAVSTDVHLEATAGSWKHGTARAVEVDEYRTRSGGRGVTISGFLREEREGMILGRGAILTARGGAFRRNLKAGTATLTPPAPFSGSATLKPRAGGKGVWEGSLQVPVLDGGEPIVFTGPQFKASLERREPEIDE
jgi:hypothetical protein